MSLICWGFLIVFECQAPPARPPIVVCPPLPVWSRSFQARLARDARHLQPDSAVAQSLAEHVRLREQVRRCRKTTIRK